jgi:hypothetical protein
MPAVARARNSFQHRSPHPTVANKWYAESRSCVEQLIAYEWFDGEIWDVCCGGGNIVSVFRDHGYVAHGSDLVDRGFGEVRDLFNINWELDNIVGNPPYGRKLDSLIRHCLGIARHKVALLLPTGFWNGESRYRLLTEHPPSVWYPFATRPTIPPGSMNVSRDSNGALVQPPQSGGTAVYGWVVWDVGYQGSTEICPLPPWREKKRERPSHQESPPGHQVESLEEDAA